MNGQTLISLDNIINELANNGEVAISRRLLDIRDSLLNKQSVENKQNKEGRCFLTLTNTGVVEALNEPETFNEAMDTATNYLQDYPEETVWIVRIEGEAYSSIEAQFDPNWK